MAMPMDTLKQQAELCVDSLASADAFFKLLEADYRTRIFKELKVRLGLMKNAQFVDYVQALDEKGLEVLVWAICATVKNPQLGGDRPEAFHAAITLCFLAASCMVIQQELPQLVPGQVVKLPRMHPVVVAIVSMVLFGGKQGLASWASLDPQAMHTYEASIDAVKGACPSDRMIRAVYTALFPEKQKSTTCVATQDVLTPQEAEDLIAEIETRVNQIRSKGGEDHAVTLLVDSIDAYDKSGIGSNGIVTPFFIDKGTKNTFLAIPTSTLRALFKMLIRAIQEAETVSPPAPKKTTKTSQKDSKVNDRPNVTVNGNNAIFVIQEKKSKAKLKVKNKAKVQNTNVPPELLTPLNTMLDLINKIQTKEKREELAAQFSGAIEAAKAGTPESKSRVKAALDFVKDNTGFLADIPGAIGTITDTWNKAHAAAIAALPLLSSVFP
jgi:hypothetical protein